MRGHRINAFGFSIFFPPLQVHLFLLFVVYQLFLSSPTTAAYLGYNRTI